MTGYYEGKGADTYNRTWRTFTTKTLSEVTAIVDFSALERVSHQFGRLPRVLDVACGTGVLLKQIRERVPDVELYGVDASADMLTQARLALEGQSRVHFEQQAITGSTISHLPYAQGTFDLITCTNALHEMQEPVSVLAALGKLLDPQGQLIVEDYARRTAPFPWFVIEWAARWKEPGHVRAYTLAEAHTLALQAGLSLRHEHTFSMDWLWRGWIFSASPHVVSLEERQTEEPATRHETEKE